MCHNPFFIELLSKERQKSLLEEAERIRMQRAPNPENTVGRRHFSEWLGDVLIRTGERLKNRDTTRRSGDLRSQNA